MSHAASLRARLLFAGDIALLLNSACLFAFADPTLGYFAQVAVHPLLGLALAAGAAWLALRRRCRVTGLGLVGLAVSCVGLALGVAVLVLGATTPHRLLVDAHVATSALGGLLLVVHFWRAAPRPGPPRQTWAVRASMAVALGAAAAAAIAGAGRQARWRAAYRIENPTTPPAT